MRLETLVERLREIEPETDDIDLATLALVILRRSSVAGPPDSVEETCRIARCGIQTLQDQRHAAEREVEELASETACEYQPQQLFAVVRQVRAQRQLLDLFCC